MEYFNYHAKAMSLIRNGELIGYEIMEEYHGISPALVLYFKDNRAMPIREYKFDLYFKLFKEINFKQ